MKHSFFFFSFWLISCRLFAQDAVLISEGNFVRGEIKGTDFQTVVIQEEDGSLRQFKAKDIQSFLWNGDSYVSKPILMKKKAEVWFFRVLEEGKVNLYVIGLTSGTPVQAPKVKSKPAISVGVGTGGFGSGLGGGVTFGGGRPRPEEQALKAMPLSFFIEKPGSGPIQELPLASGRQSQLKAILLSKLSGDDDLTENIRATDEFSEKTVVALIRSYNASIP